MNGRRFTDLGLLVPGSVAPSQTGFSTTPIRGVGAIAINTAGNREEAVGFVVNGITTNNLTFGSLSFQPSIASIQEFRVNNSAFSAEHGHVSGAIVGIVTRSGTDTFRGELFEFFRDDALDARNYFEFNSTEPHPFSATSSADRSAVRSCAGGRSFRGVRRLQTTAGSRHEQPRVERPAARRGHRSDDSPARRAHSAAELSSTAAASRDSWARERRPSIPIAGRSTSSTTSARTAGSTSFSASRRRFEREPASNGNSIPGFGHRRTTGGSILTIGETQVLGRGLVNEARFGRSALRRTDCPAPRSIRRSFGIRNGIERPIGLPQLLVAGGLNFGGPDAIPARPNRRVLRLRRHGASHERQALDQDSAASTGISSTRTSRKARDSFNFPSVEAFLAGTANAFSITLGERRNHISQRAAGLFVQDSLALRSDLTVELGLRWEWHVTPTERDDKFVVFDAGSASLLRVGVHLDKIHRQNNRNLEPRLGLVWDATRGRPDDRARGVRRGPLTSRGRRR